MDNSTLISALAAMVDFNSSRAEAHASFFIGSLFGLFTILAMVYGKENVERSDRRLWAIYYIIFSIMGLYFFFNFSHFATVADQFRQLIVQKSNGQINYQAVIETVNQRFLFRCFYNIKRFIHNYKLIIFPIVYGIIVLVPWYFVFLRDEEHSILDD